MSNHIVLLGDSIFDNRSYTSGQPDVVTHLRELLPSPWQATLCAVDGATTEDVQRQLGKVPSDASDLVVSIGGNDALMNLDMLTQRVSSTAEALFVLAERAHRFEASYRSALRKVHALERPITACTIYNGNLPSDQAEVARIALMIFNDAILRVAFENGFGVIDLRSVCSDPSDYANPIEPSGPGGRKIAETIKRALVTEHEGCDSRVFAGSSR